MDQVLSIEVKLVEILPGDVLFTSEAEVEAIFSFTYEGRDGDEQVELQAVKVPVPRLRKFEDDGTVL